MDTLGSLVTCRGEGASVIASPMRLETGDKPELAMRGALSASSRPFREQAGNRLVHLLLPIWGV